jgi:hypothetical protein
VWHVHLHCVRIIMKKKDDGGMDTNHSFLPNSYRRSHTHIRAPSNDGSSKSHVIQKSFWRFGVPRNMHRWHRWSRCLHDAATLLVASSSSSMLRATVLIKEFELPIRDG